MEPDGKHFTFYRNLYTQNIYICSYLQVQRIHQIILYIFPEETSSYKLYKIINYGGRSIVYKGIVNNEKVIVKKLEKKYNREIPFIALLRNVPGVVQYKTYFFDDNFVYVILQKINNTLDLYDYITKCNGKLNESLTKNILRQLINILLNCKEKKVLHNDIKESNILIDPLTKKITLIDFDAAEEWIDNFLYERNLGTWQYSCPEWHLYKCYSANDMCSWSLGILMYSMLCGNLPFYSTDEIIYSDLPKITSFFMSYHAFTFLNQCLDKNSANRIKLENMLNDKWFIEA